MEDIREEVSDTILDIEDMIGFEVATESDIDSIFGGE